MWAAQQPLALSAFGDVMDVPEWKNRPSCYLVATKTRPSRQKRSDSSRPAWATTVEVSASHVAMVSRPAEVTGLIASALQGRV